MKPRRTVYGAVHMAMHGIAEEQTRIRRFIAELERKNEQQANRIRLLKEREAASRGGMDQAEEGQACACTGKRRAPGRTQPPESRTGRHV